MVSQRSTAEESKRSPLAERQSVGSVVMRGTQPSHCSGIASVCKLLHREGLVCEFDAGAATATACRAVRRRAMLLLLTGGSGT